MLERFVGGGPGGEKRVQTFRWLLLIGLVGVGFMIIHSFINIEKLDQGGNSRTSPAPNDQQVFMEQSQPKTVFEEYEAKVGNRLKEILETIVGVGTVEVMVTIDSTEEIVVYRNLRESSKETTERDQSGGNRHITETTRSGEIVLHEVSGDQQPIVLKTIKPKIRGVVIVAKGAENVTVKKLILEAVAKGLDVPAHRISIIPRKSG
jgi:stage III sporulation protein AG